MQTPHISPWCGDKNKISPGGTSLDAVPHISMQISEDRVLVYMLLSHRALVAFIIILFIELYISCWNELPIMWFSAYYKWMPFQMQWVDLN